MKYYDLMQYISEISAEKFILENYEAETWGRFGYDIYNDNLAIKIPKTIKEYAIGWCDANRLLIRPRENQIAVMFEYNGEKFWFHMFKTQMVYWED